MGCKWVKGVTTESIISHLFENGKVYKHNGDYFLKVPRH